MLELWRKDAVYTFDFGPEVTVEPLREIEFVVNGSEITVKYLSPGDYDYLSARDVAAELDYRGREQNCEKLPVASSGVLPLQGIGEGAWRCELAYLGGGGTLEMIGRAESEGLVIELHRNSVEGAGADAMLEPFAHRIGRREAGLEPREDELIYMHGPLQVLAPRAWDSASTVDLGLEGHRPEWVDSFTVELKFIEGAQATGCLEMPNWVRAHLLDDDMLAEGEVAQQVLGDRTVMSKCWAAVPHPSEPDEPYPPDPVQTTAVAVVDWGGTHTCRIRSIQEIAYETFDRERDLAKLRDFVATVAVSCVRTPRGAV